LSTADKPLKLLHPRGSVNLLGLFAYFRDKSLAVLGVVSPAASGVFCGK
jgi:hypothetical protein